MARKRNTKSRRKASRSKQAVSSVFESLSTRYLIIALVVVTGLAMSPILTNDFISLDDENFILINPVVQDHDFAGAFDKQFKSPHYKPLVYSSWIIEHALFGNSSFVFHFTNWLLHLINTILVFFCFRHLAQRWPVTKDLAVPIGFFTALLFGVHPLHVESVAWAIERKDVMFSLFYLLGILSYIRFLNTGQQKFLVATGVLYILSLLSKSMGISLVGVLFLVDLAYGRRDWMKMVLDKWPLYIGFILALYMYGVIDKAIGDPAPAKEVAGSGGGGAVAAAGGGTPSLGLIGTDHTMYQDIIIGNYRYLLFFFHTLFPFRLAVVYAREYLLVWPGAAIHGFLLVTALIWSIPIWLKKYRDVLIFGLAFFTMAISPILVEEGAGSNFASDRYTYIPSLGILMLVSVLFLKAFPSRALKSFSWGETILLILALACSVGTFSQARKWGDGMVLFSQAIDNYPDNWLAMQYRGGAVDLSNPDQALADFTKSIELNPTRAETYYSRGTLLLNLGRLREAIPDFDFVVQRDPRHYKAFVNRANCYRDLGQYPQALEDYNYVLRMDPGFNKARNNRGVVYLNQGKINEALKDFNDVIQLDPTYANAYINRAAVYINPQVEQFASAVDDYNMCLQYEPDNTQAMQFKAYALQKLGRYDEALQSINQAIATQSDQGRFYYLRAQILRNLGRRAESVQDARQAQQMGIEVSPQYLQ